MASGPGQPARGRGRLAGSLARHRWMTVAGMTATIAAVAGGGVALALHNSSAGPRQDCGLVPCSAALPASVRATGTGPPGGTGSASTPATTAPTAFQHASAPPSPTPPSAPATAPEAAASPPARQSAGPVSPATPVAAGRASPPEAISAAAGQETSTGGGQPQSGRSRHDGWPRRWRGRWRGGWPDNGWPNAGWPNGAWPGQGGAGGGWPQGHRDGQHHDAR